jgi:Sensors of blue-light using FAD
MSLIHLVYASRPFGFEWGTLNLILSVSRANNARDDVSGALICRADLYLQMLEGPKAAVEAAFARIMRDDRHLEVNQLLCQPITERLFPGWAMRDDPARSWMWTQKEVAGGAIERATPAEVLDVFARLKAEPA